MTWYERGALIFATFMAADIGGMTYSGTPVDVIAGFGIFQCGITVVWVLVSSKWRRMR